MKKRLFILLILLALAGGEGVARSEGDPVVTIAPASSYKVRKILLAPLELPSYVGQLAFWPLGLAGRWIEKSHAVERTIDLLSNEDRTFWVYPVVEGGAGAGLGSGLGFHHSNFVHRGYSLDGRYAIFSDLSQKGDIGFVHPEAFTLGGRDGRYRISVAFDRSNHVDFFGIGNASLQALHSKFSLDAIQGGVEFDLPLVHHLHLNPHMSFLSQNTRGTGEADSTEVLFPATTLPGFGRWLTYLDAGFTLSHDTRDVRGQTQRGGVQSFAFRRMQGLGTDDFDYNQYEIEIRHYIPLWAPRRVLILRNAWEWKQATGGLVPFHQFNTLDVHSPLRGFDRGRFRDRGSVIFNAEYRYPIWDIIDGTVFFDTGRVFGDPGDFAFKDFKYSAGGGVQFVTKNFFLFRFQAASGGEGVNLVFDVSTPL